MGRAGTAELLKVWFGVRQRRPVTFSCLTAGVYWAVSSSINWTLQLPGDRIVLRMDEAVRASELVEEGPWQAKECDVFVAG